MPEPIEVPSLAFITESVFNVSANAGAGTCCPFNTCPCPFRNPEQHKQCCLKNLTVVACKDGSDAADKIPKVNDLPAGDQRLVISSFRRFRRVWQSIIFFVTIAHSMEELYLSSLFVTIHGRPALLSVTGWRFRTQEKKPCPPMHNIPDCAENSFDIQYTRHLKHMLLECLVGHGLRCKFMQKVLVVPPLPQVAKLL